MKAKILMVLVSATLIAANAPENEDPVLKEVEEAIAKLSLAFENRDAAVIKRLTTPDHMAIRPFYGEPQGRAEEIRSLLDLEVTEYTKGKFNMRLLSKEVALIVYPLQLKGTFKGEELLSKNYASSVWVKHGGQWLEAFYQETPVVGGQ